VCWWRQVDQSSRWRPSRHAGRSGAAARWAISLRSAGPARRALLIMDVLVSRERVTLTSGFCPGPWRMPLTVDVEVPQRDREVLAS
jgi:hypothetical protein